MHKLDKFDRKILTALQENARLTNLALADQIGLSPSPCFRRVRVLEEAGIIEGYHAHINRAAAGLGLTIFINVSLNRHDLSHLRTIEKAIEEIPEIVSAHTIAGEYDYLLEMVVSDLNHFRELNRKMSEMPGIREMRSHFVINDIKGTRSGRITISVRP